MNLFNDIIRFKFSFLFVLLSTNYSIVWGQHELISTGTTTTIHELNRNGNTVFINGVNNYFAKCTDNCDDLVPLNPPGPLNYYNGHLNVLNTNIIYIASFLPASPYHAIISKSTNGGQNWTTVLDTISEDFFVRGLFVFDTNNLVLPVSIYNTYVSSNGGNDWLQGAQHNMLAPATSMKINDSTAIMGSLERFSITMNKGGSWQGTGFIQSSPTDFFANSFDSIYAVTESGIGSYFCYIFGTPQTDRVDKQIPMMDPKGVYVVSSNEIYIVGKGWPQETGRIMKTTDLGDTWSYYNVPETENLYDMVFINDSIALIGGNTGALIRWNKYSNMTSWDLGVIDNNYQIGIVKAYPNPVNDNQTIEINTVPGDNIEINVYDFQGRKCCLIYSGFAITDKQFITADLSLLDTGIYFYDINVGNRRAQLLVEKK